MGGKRRGGQNPGRIRSEKKEKLVLAGTDDGGGQDDCLMCWSESRCR